MKVETFNIENKHYAEFHLSEQESKELHENGFVIANAYVYNMPLCLACVAKYGTEYVLFTKYYGDNGIQNVLIDEYRVVPSYVLSELETEELEGTGYVERDDVCFTMIDTDIRAYKLIENYAGIKLTRGGKVNA